MTAPVLAPGAVIAERYQVGSVLQQGGSSTTYYCRSQDGRELAVKLYDPAMRQRADVMQLVEQVYGLTNSMPADLVARVVDAGVDKATSSPYSATERVPLASLAQTLTQRVLTPDEALVMLRGLARVVDAAHGAKLMHHALKPTNVFGSFAGQGQIRVTDFGAGLARVAVPTQEGYALATPWLAPEQVQQGMQPGATADVFAAALVVFAALTGRSYWQSCQNGTDFAAWQREVVGPREPASARAGTLGVSINRAFDPVLGCALSADPAQRYRSVGELAAALESLVASKGVGPTESSTVAFPSGSHGGDYPPPPAPMNPGAGPYAAPAAGVAAHDAAYTAGSAGGYAMAPGTHPVTAAGIGPAVGATANGLPPSPTRSTGSKAAPIVVGVAAVVLLGGAISAFVLMGKKKPPTDDGPIAIAAASASASAAAAPGASGAPDASAAASAEPAPSAEASAAPAASGDASAAPDASGAPSAAGIDVTISCEPACDDLKIDGTAVEAGKAVQLPPGKHKVVVTKEKYYPQSELITLTPGKPFEKTFAMIPAAKSTAKKDCGKFLKKCN